MEMQIYMFQDRMHSLRVSMTAIKFQVNQEEYLILSNLINQKMIVWQVNIILESKDTLNQYMNCK